MNKGEIRSLLRKRRKREQNRTEKDAAICINIRRLPEFERAKVVFAYCAAAGEPEVSPVIKAALQAGKRVLLPMTEAEGEMLAVEYRAGDGLYPGVFGIMEPKGEAFPPENIDLVLCPGVGFDKKGTRLGQGGGFYDRYLEKIHPFCVGICYTDCMVDELPQETHDRCMDAVVTESGIWRAK